MREPPPAAKAFAEFRDRERGRGLRTGVRASLAAAAGRRPKKISFASRPFDFFACTVSPRR